MIVPLYRFTPFGKQINYEVYKALEEMKIIIARTNPKTIKTIIDIYNEKEGEFSNKDFEDIKRMLLENHIFHSKKPSFFTSKRTLISAHGGTLEKRKLSDTDLATTTMRSIKPKTYYTLNFGVEVECFLEITDKFIKKIVKKMFQDPPPEYITELIEGKIDIEGKSEKEIIEIIKKGIKPGPHYDKQIFYNKINNIEFLSKLLKLKNIEPKISKYSISSEYKIKTNDYDTIKTKDFIITGDSSVVCYDECSLYHKIDDADKNFKDIITTSLFKYIEFVSPIFKTTTEVKKGLIKLNYKIYKFFGEELFNSEKTSNHIHFSLNKNGKIQTGNDPEFIMVFISLWIVLEPFIISLCAYFRKDNKYCETVPIPPDEPKKYLTLDILTNIDKRFIIKTLSEIIFQLNDRYHTLNVTNLFENIRPDKPTLEIRVKHGSSDPEEIEQFCILIERIVRKAEIILEELKDKKDVSIIDYIKEKEKETKTLDFLECTQKEKEYWEIHIEKLEKFNPMYEKKCERECD